MHFQAEFYNHLINGQAGDAAPILARLALNVAHDSGEYPFPFELLATVGNFERKLGTQGLNEFFAMECARAAVLREFAPWRQDQVAKLRLIAQMPQPETLNQRFPFSKDA